MKSSARLTLDMRNSASTFAEAQVKRKAVLPCKEFNKAVQFNASILEGMRRGCSKTFQIKQGLPVISWRVTAEFTKMTTKNADGLLITQSATTVQHKSV